LFSVNTPVLAVSVFVVTDDNDDDYDDDDEEEEEERGKENDHQM